MNTKPVRQEDPMGCGVACVAFLLGKSYQQTLKLFPQGKKRAMTVGFTVKMVRTALMSSKESYKQSYLWPTIRHLIYQNGSIVYLKHSKKFPYGHYIARSNGIWMNPWINLPEKPIKAGFQKRLPEQPSFVIFKTG